MNPYSQAIEILRRQAEISEQNAPIHEAEGDHAQGALARITAASCRAAIARLGGEGGARPDYTWDDIASYTEVPNHSEGTLRFFLAMRDGSEHKVTVLPGATEAETRAAVLQTLKQPVP